MNWGFFNWRLIYYSNLDSVLTTGYLSYGNDCVNINLYIQLARLSSLAYE
jgi:hypothetical protein